MERAQIPSFVSAYGANGILICQTSIPTPQTTIANRSSPLSHRAKSDTSATGVKTFCNLRTSSPSTPGLLASICTSHSFSCWSMLLVTTHMQFLRPGRLMATMPVTAAACARGMDRVEHCCLRSARLDSTGCASSSPRFVAARYVIR